METLKQCVPLLQALSSVLIMFVIQWVYAVANIGVALLLFLYIGKANPGLPPGDCSLVFFQCAFFFSIFKYIIQYANVSMSSIVTPRSVGVPAFAY